MCRVGSGWLVFLLAACAAPTTPEPPPFRLGVAARPGDGVLERASPLSYSGGFETKTFLFENLVRKDAEGRLAPGLASTWDIGNGGRTFRFTLREGARFHDGTPVTAAAVADHLRCWVGHEEHDWLGASTRIQAVVPESPRVLRVDLDQPWALLDELCAINPCAIQKATDADALIGSGPFRLQQVREEGHVLRLTPVHPDQPPRTLDLVLWDKNAPDDPVDALRRGDLDGLVDGWHRFFTPAQVAELAADARFTLVTGPGSSVHYLAFRHQGPTAELALRLRIAAAVDRTVLVQAVEGGRADPCRTWAAPTVADWPRSQPPPAPAGILSLTAPLQLLVHEDDLREQALAAALKQQLTAQGIPVTLDAVGVDDYSTRVEEGAFDLRLAKTWGVPYDPLLSLRDRFPELAGELMTIPDPTARAAARARVQERMDQEVLLVPLYVPHRIGFLRADRPHPAVLLDHDLHRIGFAPDPTESQ